MIPPAGLLRLSQLRVISPLSLLRRIARRQSVLPVLRARLFYPVRSVTMDALRRRAHLGPPLMILRRPLSAAVVVFAPAVATVVIAAAPMTVIISAVVIIRAPVRTVIVTRRPPGVVIAVMGVIGAAAVI